MKDFEDAFSKLENHAGLAMDVLSKVQIGSLTSDMPHIDPADDRLQSCVVCYGGAGAMGYVCPQCYHTVCLECLQKLPQANCPHCRHQATDMAIAHTMVQFAKTGSQQSSKLYESAASLAFATSRVPMHLDLGPHPLTAEDAGRRMMCLCCSQPASSTNYICPACSVTLCFECAKEVLVARPQCPGCGEIERVAATVPQYIAANEAWASAAQLGDAISRSLSDVTRRFSSMSSSGDEINHSHSRGPSMLLPAGAVGPRGASGGYTTHSPQHAGHFHEQAHFCCLCRSETSLFDHVCPCCRASCCANCICNRLPREDLRCPSCNDAANNVHGLSLIASAHKARHSWSNFWGSVVESFGGESPHGNVQSSPNIPPPPDSCSRQRSGSYP